MTLIIEHILPPQNLPAHLQHDSISLQWHETDRRILHKTSRQGRNIILRLLHEGTHLHHGDLIFRDDQTAITIDIEPCQAIILSPQTMPDMARACYEIGNKHAPLFIEDNQLLLPYEKPLFEWLQSAGFTPQQDTRRLNRRLRANSAQQEGRHHHHHHHHHEH